MHLTRETLQRENNSLARWQMTFLAVIWVLSVAVVVLSFTVWKLNSRRFTMTCADFSSQRAADKMLWLFPTLDGNNDGIACNNLPL